MNPFVMIGAIVGLTYMGNDILAQVESDGREECGALIERSYDIATAKSLGIPKQQMLAGADGLGDMLLVARIYQGDWPVYAAKQMAYILCDIRRETPSVPLPLR